MKQVKLYFFIPLCLAAAGWAFYLIGLHHEVVAGLDAGACGEGQGCGAVLQSEWSELFGIPVSAPAVPMYILLALYGIQAMRGKLSFERLAGLASLCGGAGLVFGGWLLFHMLYHVAEVCRFCLIMDTLNLGVLGLGAAIHPAGIREGLKGFVGTIKRLFAVGPEGLVLPALVLGTALVHTTTQPPASAHELASSTSPSDTKSASTKEASPGETQPKAKAPTRPTSSATKASGPPKPGTRRLVLPETVHTINLDASVPSKGPKSAPVEIVVFEDFQCPYCKKLSGNLELLMEERPEQIQLRFVHFPMHKSCNDSGLKKNLHKFACSAAAASVCAEEQGRFWEMHDLLFRNNSRLRGRNLKQYAREAQLDLSSWSECMGAPSTLAKVKADAAAASALGVKGTPALLINGRMLRGAQPVASLQAAIDTLLTNPEGRVLLDVEMQEELTGSVSGHTETVSLQSSSGPFRIDAFEASIQDGKAQSVPGVAPATEINWYQAQAACEAAGKRLCTEEEWLVACTGALPIDEDRNGVFSTDLAQGRQYSYGEHWTQGLCADSRKKADPRPLITGNHPQCRSPEGVFDLEGVTKEWIGTSPDRAALKGGSYFSGTSARCAYYKDGEAPESKDGSIGFRCCQGGHQQPSADRFPGGKVGDSLKEWEGTTVDGKRFRSSALKGKPAILTFWASWCEPCKKELPALSDLYLAHKDKGLQIIGINVDKNPAAARRYLETTPLPFPIVLDSKSEIMDQFMTRGIPTTFWVKADGMIRQRTVGYDEKTRPKFEAALADLLPGVTAAP